MNAPLAVAGAPPPPGRPVPQIDLLKAVASQLIVLHHLAFYGPMADRASTLWPALFDALAQHARIAVQVFLVVGGFLAARQLAPAGRLAAGPSIAARVLGRYLRLVLPLAATLVLAVGAAALARAWMNHPSVPSAPQPAQVLAHLLLMQDLIGAEALSAGVWYVAIDFQLYVLLLALLALAQQAERRAGQRTPWAPWAVAALVVASLLWWNRIPALDTVAPYFFGAYGLGVLVAWWAPAASARLRLGLLAACVLLALGLDFRWRIAVAALVAGALAWAALRPRPRGGQDTRGLHGLRWLGNISYAVFLVHFPVCLVVNAFFDRFMPADAAVQALGVALAWAASVAAGALFHHGVERPLLQRVKTWRRRAPALAA